VTSTTGRFLTLMLALGAAWPAAQAQTRFPERTLTFVVPFGPGGTTDIMARILADEYGRQLGASVVVVNTAGAGGAIGMANVARAKPDGYTLSMTTIGPLTIQPARRDNTGYSPADFDYVCGTYDVPVMTMVSQASPNKTYAELVAWARANPGKLSYGSSGIGTALHITGLQQWKFHGIDALHVPYKSTGEMVGPLKGGELTMFNETPPVATQHQLRPLVVMSDRRAPGFDHVPSAAELGLPVRGSVWGGLVAPKGLPADVKAKLESACQAATATATYRERADKANSPLVYRTGSEFQRFALDEYERFKKVVVENGLQER
jgi:tripartite-type tricarboxylate transporter receptor subunit TctC